MPIARRRGPERPHWARQARWINPIASGVRGGVIKGRSVACIAGFIAATVALTWPLAREFGRALPTVGGFPDALVQVFILNWDLRSLATHPLGVFDAPIFFPEKNTLAYMDHLLGEAVVAAPIAALTRNPAAAYNAVVVFSCIASAWAMYRLARLGGISSPGSFLCGLLFTFSPYRYSNMANLNLLQTEFLPLGIFFALRYSSRKRTRDLLATGATLAVQSYFSWYYTYFLAVALAVLAFYQIAAGRFRWRELLERRVLTAGLATLALMLPGLVPYVMKRTELSRFGRSLGAASYWSADLLDYLRTNVQNRLFGHVHWLVGGQSYWPGLAVVIFAWLGIRTLPRRDDLPAATPAATPFRRIDAARQALGRAAMRYGDGGFFVSLTAVGFILSLGPVLKVAGRLLWIPLPYTVLFFTVPGFSGMRASGRFAVLALLGSVLLAGFGYEWCRRRFAPRGLRALALFSIALALALAGSLSTPWPLVAFPQRDDLPPVYAWLERQPGPVPVLELPVPAKEADEGEREVTRQLYAIYHRKPLVDGVNGFVSPRHSDFRAVMQGFPAPETIRAAAARGTRVVIVHFGDWGAAEGQRLRAAADRAPGLRNVVEFGTDVAYEITAR